MVTMGGRISYQSEIPLKKVKDIFCTDIGYQTPKIDTRAAIEQLFEELKLHIQESYEYAKEKFKKRKA